MHTRQSTIFARTCRHLFVSMMPNVLKATGRFIPTRYGRSQQSTWTPQPDVKAVIHIYTTPHATRCETGDTRGRLAQSRGRQLHLFHCRSCCTLACPHSKNREPTAQNRGSVRHTNTEENLRILCVIRQVRLPDPIFYDDEDTALLLHCKFNKLHSSGLLAWHKHLSQQTNRARTRHRKQTEKETGLSDYCISRTVVLVELWTSLAPLPVRQKHFHFPDVSKVLYETQRRFLSSWISRVVKRSNLNHQNPAVDVPPRIRTGFPINLYLIGHCQQVKAHGEILLHRILSELR